MVFHFHHEAKRELREAILYYHAREPDLNLGAIFNQQVRDACESLRSTPLIYRERDEGFRRKNLGRFPFYLGFVIREKRILILAVAHSHSRPGYWLDRISELP